MIKFGLNTQKLGQSREKDKSRQQADQRANLRLIVHDLALLLACLYDPDVELPDLFAFLSLDMQKGDKLVSLPISRSIDSWGTTGFCRPWARRPILTMELKVLSGSMQITLLEPSERVTRPLMFFLAFSGEKMLTSTT